ncbi:MAG: caspase family protein [Bacteroidota bacterium]
MFRLIVCLLISTCSLSLFAQGNCIKGDCRNGYGEYLFADGARYVGDFSRGRIHGRGILYYTDSTKYIGNWVDQHQHGRGRMVFPDGSIYFGNFQLSKFHGAGKFTFANGNVLEAVWQNGVSGGEGKFMFANGDYYEGGIRDNKLEGMGLMQYANGDQYLGEWQNNMREGRGKIIFENGTEVEGSWDADQYRANWTDLGYTGNRDLLLSCNQGCPDGEGKYVYPDGTVFFGRVAGGLPAGEGTVIFNNGNIFQGEYRQHRAHGLGLMTYADGQIAGGIWREGRLYRRLYQAQGRPARPIDVDENPEVKVWAVIVGAARYLHMPTLNYTDNDAFHLFAFLKSPEGGALPDEQIRLLIDEDATHRNIIMSMREVYLRADENDVVLFYFSGHGLRGSFLPVDYDGFDNKLEHYEIRDALVATRARHKLIIADACHSGSLTAPLQARPGGIGEALQRYYDALNDANPGTALLLSSKGEEYSLEDGGLRSGVFSHYLIRGMKGEADINSDMLISIEELFQFVHREVRRYTGNIQTPTLSGDYDATMPVAVIRN